MAASSIGPDAVNMMRLKQYSEMHKKLNKRATLRAAKYDANAIGIKSNMFSQALIKDKNDNQTEGGSDFPAVLVSERKEGQTSLRCW